MYFSFLPKQFSLRNLNHPPLAVRCSNAELTAYHLNHRIFVSELLDLCVVSHKNISVHEVYGHHIFSTSRNFV